MSASVDSRIKKLAEDIAYTMEVDGKFAGFSDAEKNLLKVIVESGNSDVFEELITKAVDGGWSNGVDYERSNSFMS
ncbi:hypothetical protein ACIBEJ_00645 [Nonomuraea sp. NPDC050790]|uniref:hypothetical protein n=1 Tax=Nonomuraea sp. NPDC050790 TaxID=3364371 RepID=UPI0037BB7A40